MSDEVLTTEALRKLTGYRQRSKQCAWLARAGIWFQPDSNGDPSTTWYHVNNPLSLRMAVQQDPVLDTPNFGAIQNGRKTKKPR